MRKIDDTEINGLIATEVMGWHLSKGGKVWLDADGSWQVKVRSWRPVGVFRSDIGDAWRVRAKVATWRFSQRLAFKKALQQIISDRLGIDGLIGAEEIILVVESRDICLAALRAVGVEVRNDG